MMLYLRYCAWLNCALIHSIQSAVQFYISYSVIPLDVVIFNKVIFLTFVSQLLCQIIVIVISVMFSLCFRLCSLMLSRLVILKPLENDLQSVILAVKMQVMSTSSVFSVSLINVCINYVVYSLLLFVLKYVIHTQWWHHTFIQYKFHLKYNSGFLWLKQELVLFYKQQSEQRQLSDVMSHLVNGWRLCVWWW